jgi:hypothetical protein
VLTRSRHTKPVHILLSHVFSVNFTNNMTPFWDIAQSNLVGVDRPFQRCVFLSCSKMSVYSNETIRSYIPEDSHLHTRRHENLKFHNFYIIFSRMSRSFQWPLLYDENVRVFLSHIYVVTPHIYPSYFDFLHYIWRRVCILKRLFTQFSLASCCFLPLSPRIFFKTSLSNAIYPSKIWRFVTMVCC